MLPKIILTDIDGVWTDGGMYYDENTAELKKFNTSDSGGVLFCKLLGIEVGIITGENSNIVKRRADKLKIDICCTGIKDKVKCVQDIIGGKYAWNEVAYIGDDINDINLLKMVGIKGVPNNAPDYVKKYATIRLNKNGGEGVFREFVEAILKENDKLDEVLEIYLRNGSGFIQHDIH